jgi:hypothetical protein
MFVVSILEKHLQQKRVDGKSGGTAEWVPPLKSEEPQTVPYKYFRKEAKKGVCSQKSRDAKKAEGGKQHCQGSEQNRLSAALSSLAGEPGAGSSGTSQFQLEPIPMKKGGEGWQQPPGAMQLQDRKQKIPGTA